jgi:probable HAF family extracellular repeat protein
MFVIRRLGVVFAAILALFAVGARSEANYRVIDLGTLGGHFAATTGLNNNNQVIGYSSIDPKNLFDQHGFLYNPATSTTPASMIKLGADAIPYAINDHGLIVGVQLNYATSPSPQPFQYDSAAPTPASTPIVVDSPYIVWTAKGVNNDGTIVGYALKPNFPNAPVNAGYSVAADGTQTLLSLFGGTDTTASGINDHGVIVGSAQLSPDPSSFYDPPSHAFLRSADGTITDLGTLGEPANPNSARSGSGATGINNNGDIIGLSQNGHGSTYYAFYLPNGGSMQAISTGNGFASMPYGLNSSGAVVGSTLFDGAGGITHGFLFSGGNLFDLNNLLDPTVDLNMVITQATGINDLGYISANARDYEGNSHALLLVQNSPNSPFAAGSFEPLTLFPPPPPPPPAVPEPSSLALLILGTGAISLAAWKRRAKGKTPLAY